MKTCPMCTWAIVSFRDPEDQWAASLMESLYQGHMETHVEDFRIELGLMTHNA